MEAIMKLNIKDLEPNTGQVEGVPQNPRFIKDKKFEALKDSLLDDPEFMDLNPILVYQQGKKYVVMGGNMRCRAAIDLGWEEIEASVMPENTPVEVIRARVIKHNSDYGENDTDILANEWAQFIDPSWGLDIEIPDFEPASEDEQGKLDEKKKVTCPNCQHEFEA